MRRCVLPGSPDTLVAAVEANKKPSWEQNCGRREGETPRVEMRENDGYEEGRGGRVRKEACVTT